MHYKPLRSQWLLAKFLSCGQMELENKRMNGKHLKRRSLLSGLLGVRVHLTVIKITVL